MRRFHHPFLALLLSLLLIGSQQAAFAHLLSHTQRASEAAAQSQYQSDHGSIDGVAETCTSCIAFSGVGGGAPPSAHAGAHAVFASESYRLPLAAAIAARPLVHHRARAPPVVL